jgi:glycosyltransferase involved in cell wall biosynthesis
LPPAGDVNVAIDELLRRTLILIPAYNEAANLGSTVERLREVLPDVDVLVIDDASDDDTARVAREPGVTVVRNPVNLGIGGAVQTGFRYALRHGYEATVEHDADGQHDPAAIEELLAPLARKEADVAIGSRYVAPGRGGYRPAGARRLGVAFFSTLTSLLAGKRFRDVTSGQWAANRRALEFLAEFFPNDYPDAQAILAAHRAGLRIVEVAVAMRPRVHGVSTTNLWRSLLYPFSVTIAVVVEFLRRKAKPEKGE